MKKLLYLIFESCIGCFSTKTNINYDVLNCHILEMKEYQYAFRFKALNKDNDTILIISLKENYYNKYGYKKIILSDLQEVELNNNYNFYLTQKKPTVSTMEQLGAFIIIEKDTLWKSSIYNDVPPSFMSHNTIGKYYGKKAR